MVKVRDDQPKGQDGKIDIPSWISKLLEAECLSPNDSTAIQAACDKALSLDEVPGDQLKGWGRGYSTFQAGLDMAEIVVELQLDADSVVAAILYRSVRENKIDLESVKKEFGPTVMKLIDGVKKMAAISGLSNHTGSEVFGKKANDQADNVRKMLVAMIDDVRVALIKLAERTCAIRTAKNAPMEKRLRVAREVFDIYAPLAHRLGIGHIKWELEDLSFRYLQPYDYKYIAKLLDERRVDRQVYIDGVIAIVTNALGQENIEIIDISGRAKHIYSIWRKMRRKGISFSEVYDIRAVRILLRSEADCYLALGIVHSLWRNIPKEFDDYIANPKENGYRSLHTAVKGPANKELEIQIRTETMHEEAEFGVCAHWRYKKSDEDSGAGSYEKKIEWLREVLEWHDEIGGSPWDEALPSSMEQDRIYVFTPNGHVIDLPESATPVDFAFRIHSDVGLRCKGAKVNGKIIPLNSPLRTADQVEIITGNREAPSRDWLNMAFGYISTSRARSRLQSWFKLQDREQNIADGRALLDREFLRLGVKDIDYQQLATKLKLNSVDNLYSAVSTGDLSVARIAQVAQRLFNKDVYDQTVASLVGRAHSEESESAPDVYIDGVGNLMCYLAPCCNPVPGDQISGYITQGRGVSIHRQDCSNILQHESDEPEKMIKVDWADKQEQRYAVNVVVEAFDRHGLLRDITAILDTNKVNISAMQTLSDKDKNTVDMNIQMEIVSFSELSLILARLAQVPNVISARRKA